MSSHGVVMSVGAGEAHTFSKPPRGSVTLLAGLGVQGDAHQGKTVKHRSRVARDPTQPNFRHVHILQTELFDELADRGFQVSPGDLGENISTRGLDLLGLCRGTRLHFSRGPVVEVTGLRNPCGQIETFCKGLLAAVVERDQNGGIIRKAGIMGIVVRGGEVRPGDAIELWLPAGRRAKLETV